MVDQYPGEHLHNTWFQFEWCEVAVLDVVPCDPNSGHSFISKTLPRKRSESVVEAYSHAPDYCADHNWGGRTNQIPLSCQLSLYLILSQSTF